MLRFVPMKTSYLWLFVATTALSGSLEAVVAPGDFCGFREELEKARAFHLRHPTAPYVIRFAAGVWKMSETLALGKGDSHVVLAPEEGATVVFDGGVEIADWQPWKENPSVLTATLPAGTPRVGPQHDFGAAFYMGVKDYPCDELRYTTDLYEDDEPLVVARWPNAGTVEFDRGDATNRLITFRNARVRRWATAKDPMALGWWQWRYKEAATRIKVVDAEAGVFRLMDDASPAPGKRIPTPIQDIRNPFFVFNMLEELDAPGEWHFDAEAQRLYVWPRKRGARYVFPVFNRTFVSVTEADHVVVRGFVFRNGRQHAMRFLNARDCAFVGNTVERFGGFALIAQEAFGLRVQDNRMSVLSHGGMVVRANHDDPRPSGIVVFGNDVSRFMLRARSYCPALHLEANNAIVSHNDFHDGASSAIRLEGSCNVVEWNRIERVVQESDDQGGLDIYGNPYYFGNVIRYNLWKDFGGDGIAATMQGGVRLDDGVCDTLVMGNVFDNTSRGAFGAVQINGGNGNVVCSNVVRNCSHFVSGMAWTRELHWLQDRYDHFFNPANRPLFMKKVLAIPEPPADRISAVADKSRHDVNDIFGNRLYHITDALWPSEKWTPFCRTNDNLVCASAAEAKGPVPESHMGVLDSVERARVFARRREDGRELYLGPCPVRGPFPRVADIDTTVLRQGHYDVFVRLDFRAERDGRFLVSKSGRSVVTVEGLDLTDYVFSCRVSDELGFAVRAQPGLTQRPDTWKWYETGAFPSRRNRTAKVVNSRWRTLGNEWPLGAVVHKAMHDVSVRCEGTNLTVTIDGRRVVRTDPENTYPRGTIAFRSPDSGRNCHVGDVRVVDLKTGKTLFADSFAQGLGKWRQAAGKWEVEAGYPDSYDLPIGSVLVSPAAKPPVRIKVVRDGDDQALYVDGERVLPLFFSNGLGMYAYSPDVYDAVRRTYDAGLRFFAPIVNASDMRAVDDVIAQVLAQCPEAKFLPRVGTPVPKDLPQGEHIRMSDGTGDRVRRDWIEDSKVENSVSLASEYYRTNSVPKIVDDLVGHFSCSQYADHLLGLLLTGGGYEGNWGAGGMWPKYLLDLSPAVMDGYGRFLRAKYGTEEALRAAWGRADASFARPPVPSFRERTISHVGGFRDPSRRESRWIDDFLDYYTHLHSRQWCAMYGRLREKMPDGFHASFGGGPCLNASFGIIQARVPANARGWNPVSALVSIETYGDRGPGGVSICTDYGNESVRRAGHFHLQELDLRPPGVESQDYSWEALAQVFRREFAVQVLMRRDAMWYYDMGFTGPWYDHPAALAEIAADVKAGGRYLGVKRRKATEAVIVQDGRMLKYYAMSPQPWTGEKDIPYSTPIYYYENYATHAPEGVMRMGAAVDGINIHDLAAFKDAYRLYVFPVSGYLTAAERRLVRQIAERGATCVLMGPAGLVDERRASVENMRDLLGFTVGVGPVGPQTAALADGTRIGAGRWFDNAMAAKWHTFHVEDHSLGAKATYPDGRTAMVCVPAGKGRIVYSGVALTCPAVYRALAREAGVHVYLDTDDFTYADGNFIVIHAKYAGRKHVVLRSPVAEVREIFSERVLARQADGFELDMKAGETAVLHLKR